MIKYKNISLVFQNVQTIIGLVGIIGNLITIIIFGRKTFKKYSYSFYSRLMAFNDILLLAHTLRHWSNLVLDFNIEFLSPVFCMFLDYHAFVAGSVSLWLRTLIQIDQLSNIVYLNRCRALKKRPVQIILVVIVVAVCSLMHLALTFECPSRRVKTYFLSTETISRNLLIVFVNLLFNLLVNLALNAVVISFRNSVRKKTQNNMIQIHQHPRNVKLAIGSIGRNIMYFLFKLPFALYLIFSSYFQLSPEQFQLVFTITVTLSIFKNAATFFINMILNTIFYEEFFHFFSSSSSVPVFV